MKLLGLDKELLPPTAVTNSSSAACMVGYAGCNGEAISRSISVEYHDKNQHPHSMDFQLTISDLNINDCDTMLFRNMNGIHSSKRLSYVIHVTNRGNSMMEMNMCESD